VLWVASLSAKYIWIGAPIIIAISYIYQILINYDIKKRIKLAIYFSTISFAHVFFFMSKSAKNISILEFNIKVIVLIFMFCFLYLLKQTLDLIREI